MLTQRTNVLFSPDEHKVLVSLSKAQHLTMGELIRQAVRKTYTIKPNDSFAASLARIRQMTKGIKVKNSEYRSFIENGRKYED